MNRNSIDDAMTAAVERLLAASRQWGRRTRLFRAPGRVNLIGEHTDYNDGFVFPAAIGFSAFLACAPREDRRIVVHSRNFAETAEFDLDQLPVRAQGNWSDYVAGVIFELSKAGVISSGADMIIEGLVPLGAGLSSSAALETVVALALVSLSDAPFDRSRLALLCQAAERDFVGVRVGIMDQFVSAQAQKDHALLLDCRSLEFRLAPLPADVRLVMCNTMVHHKLAGSEYNQRRKECESGVAILATRFSGVTALRDVTLDQLQQLENQLDPVIYRRCRHVVSENARTLEAFELLHRRDFDAFGELMYRSHQSLQSDYEVSCPELDRMVEIASGLPGVFGARMTGGGFGGCTVNLVRDSSVESFCDVIAPRYREATGIEPEIYVSGAVQGAEEIPLDVSPGAHSSRS